MNAKSLFGLLAITAAMIIGATAYAGGGMGSVMGGSGTGGMGGSGMMGGNGNGMMGFGQNFSSPWTSQPQRSPAYQYEEQQTQRLRESIRQKRHELSDLYRSENPDKSLISRKIEELAKLESELDHRMSGR